MLFTSSTDVYFSLNGEVIPNHGYVEISDIGISDDDTALLCHTNRPDINGHWFAPDGTKVESNSTAVPGFVRNRVPTLVRLIRTSGTQDEGIYWCDVNNALETHHTVYVGLYNTGGGMYVPHQFTLSYIPMAAVSTILLLSPQIISGQITIYTRDSTSDPNGDSPQFTLTCISTGGPATTVTWTRDSTTTVTEGTETVLDDPETAQYTHTLTVTAAGEYTCTIANSVSSDSADITLEGMIHIYCVCDLHFIVALCAGASPPSDVEAVQNGLTSIIVTWTASSDATGYRIYYTSDSDSGSKELGGSATGLTLSSLKNGDTYSISIVAISQYLPTSSPITTEVELCECVYVCVVYARLHISCVHNYYKNSLVR